MRIFSREDLKHYIGETAFDSSVVIQCIERGYRLYHDGDGRVYLKGDRTTAQIANVRSVHLQPTL